MGRHGLRLGHYSDIARRSGWTAGHAGESGDVVGGPRRGRRRAPCRCRCCSVRRRLNWRGSELRTRPLLPMMEPMTVRVLGLLPLVAGLAIAAPVPSGGSLVHGRGYSGVIFPASSPEVRELLDIIMSPSEIAGYWTPGARDVEALESRLGRTLRESRKHPELLVPEVRPEWPRVFRLQGGVDSRAPHRVPPPIRRHRAEGRSEAHLRELLPDQRERR